MIYDRSACIAPRWYIIAIRVVPACTLTLDWMLIHMITHWVTRKSPGSDLSIVSLGEKERVGRSEYQTMNDNGRKANMCRMGRSCVTLRKRVWVWKIRLHESKHTSMRQESKGTVLLLVKRVVCVIQHGVLRFCIESKCFYVTLSPSSPVAPGGPEGPDSPYNNNKNWYLPGG